MPPEQTRAKPRRPAPFAKRLSIIPRARCHQKTFDLTAIGARERPGALALRIQQWSPYAQTRSYIAWKSAHAMVWVWDQPPGPQDPKKAAAQTPETLIHPPGKNGAALLACTQGYEGQYWKDGILRASRWWPHQPDNTQWRQFLNPQAPAQTAVAPGPQQPVPLNRPWAQNQAADADSPGHNQKRLLTLVLALPCFGVGLELTHGLQLHQQLQADQQRTQTLQMEIDDLLQARQQAQSAQEKVRYYHKLDTTPPQLILIETLQTALQAAADLQISGWNLSADELELHLQGDAPDPKTIVTALQAANRLADIRVEALRNSEEIRVTARRLAPAPAP